MAFSNRCVVGDATLRVADPKISDLALNLHGEVKGASIITDLLRFPKPASDSGRRWIVPRYKVRLPVTQNAQASSKLATLRHFYPNCSEHRERTCRTANVAS